MSHHPAMLKLAPDALARWVDDCWILSNPRVRSHVELDSATFGAVLRLAAGASERDWSESLAGGIGYSRSGFTNAKGLMADPTGLVPERGPAVRGSGLLRLLRDAWLIHAGDDQDYLNYLAPRVSVLDQSRLGTFHQCVGSHVLLTRRQRDTWRWWHDQKFTADGLSVRPGPYLWVQEYFLKHYFSSRELQGRRLLDYACGNGYYANFFASLGAEVWGVDTSADLTAIARRNHGDRLRLLQPATPEACEAALAEMPAEFFDCIYLGDALLFFFHDFKQGQHSRAALDRLLKQFHRLLRADGRFYLMEPNGTFWLASRFGGATRPLAIVPEYREPLYHVAPTSDRIINALSDADFSTARYIHPEVDPAAASLDPAFFAYAKAFPIWDFYCFVKSP